MTDPVGGGSSGTGRRHPAGRRRWRTKLLLGGGIIVLGGGLVALALASWGLQELRFSPSSVTGFRIAFLVTLAALVGLWLVRPMRRRVTDLQVALYVEEHEPSLQAAMLSAVDIGATSGGERPADVPAGDSRSDGRAGRRACRTIQGGREIGKTTIRRRTVVLGALAAAAALLLVVGPEFFRQGASALLVLSRSAEAASPYAIKVTPGDVTVPKGSDQIGLGRSSPASGRTNVALMMQAEGEQTFQRVPLVESGEAGDVRGHAVRPQEAAVLLRRGRRREVADLHDGASSSCRPSDTLELEYVFPAYTGLPPQKVESGGDVAALRGTEVRVRVKSTMATPGGALRARSGRAGAV